MRRTVAKLAMNKANLISLSTQITQQLGKHPPDRLHLPAHLPAPLARLGTRLPPQPAALTS